MASPRRDIRVCADLDALSRAAARYFLEVAIEAINTRGRFTVALAGGSTPRMMYEQLAFLESADRLDWGQFEVFWGDERCVAPNDPRSNYWLAWNGLLAQVPIDGIRVHRIKGELGAEAAAAEYEHVLREAFGLPTLERPPSFDLILLGIGKDGHTASLFPRDPALREKAHWTSHVALPDMDPRVPRVTLTLPVINAARRVWFLVSGESKQPILRTMFDEPVAASTMYPAAMVHPAGELIWYIDYAALGRRSTK